MSVYNKCTANAILCMNMLHVLSRTLHGSWGRAGRPKEAKHRSETSVDPF